SERSSVNVNERWNSFRRRSCLIYYEREGKVERTRLLIDRRRGKRSSAGERLTNVNEGKTTFGGWFED
ncbi:MAG: hypothetical protein ACTS53_01640, partial [Candidatus Hodgkinia cicadicola]